MVKKDKKAMEKRRQKSVQKKQQKRKSTPDGRQSVPVPTSGIESYFETPFTGINPPEGFRHIPMSQAMMEYSKPLMEVMKANDIDSLNEAMQIGLLLWNYNIAVPGITGDSKTLKSQAIELIRSKLGMDEKEARELFSKMIERKEWLFPEEVQPKGSLYMFMRKEVTGSITKFDYKQLKMSAEPIAPDPDDVRCMDMIRRMDRYLEEGTEYDDWEDHFFKMEDACRERYGKWLRDKGVEEFADVFSYHLEIFLDFIYRYGHDSNVFLKSVSIYSFEEFFLNHLPRKMMAEPQEYPVWAPAIKLFYAFLNEKGYVKDSRPFTLAIDQVEPDFIKFLQKHFG